MVCEATGKQTAARFTGVVTRQNVGVWWRGSFPVSGQKKTWPQPCEDEISLPVLRSSKPATGTAFSRKKYFGNQREGCSFLLVAQGDIDPSV